MSSRLRTVSDFARRLGRTLRPNDRNALLLAAILLVSLTAACSPKQSAPDSDASREDRVQSEASLTSVEGLTFVRDGSIWTVSDGEARRVVGSEGIRSLRDNRTGDAVTWVESDGARTVVMTASTSDWTPESIWENELGSLLSEAVHDDITDTVWFSVSGEVTTTIGAVERLAGAAPREVLLAVDVAASIALNPADGALLLVSATQEPATLVQAGNPPLAIVDAARLFSPRVSRDGRFAVATGALNPEDDIGLLLIDVERGTVRTLPAGRGVPTDPAWSPSGDTIAFRDSLTQTIWTVAADDDAAHDSGLHADEGGLAW